MEYNFLLLEDNKLSIKKNKTFYLQHGEHAEPIRKKNIVQKEKPEEI